jgi:hypothetical protein
LGHIRASLTPSQHPEAQSTSFLFSRPLHGVLGVQRLSDSSHRSPFLPLFKFPSSVPRRSRPQNQPGAMQSPRSQRPQALYWLSPVSTHAQPSWPIGQITSAGFGSQTPRGISAGVPESAAHQAAFRPPNIYHFSTTAVSPWNIRHTRCVTPSLSGRHRRLGTHSEDGAATA